MHVECRHCGKYAFPEQSWLDLDTSEKRTKLAGWVRDENSSGAPEPIITEEKSREVTSRPMPKYVARGKRALQWLTREVGLTDAYRNETTTNRAFWAATYSINENEAYNLIRLLEAEGWAEILHDLKTYRLTPRGILAAEALVSTSTSVQGFVAMSLRTNDG